MRDVPSSFHIGRFRTDAPSASVGHDEDARITQTKRAYWVPRQLRLVTAMLLATATAVIAAMALGQFESSVKPDGPPLHPRLPEAQRAQAPRLNIAATIVADPSSQPPLQVWIDPSDQVPAKSILHLSGLPPGISFSTGSAIGPGEWVIPLSALSSLIMNVPANVSGEFEVIITLFGGWDETRTLTAQTTTKLMIAPRSATPAPAKMASSAPTTEPEQRSNDATQQVGPAETRTALVLTPEPPGAIATPGPAEVAPPPAGVANTDRSGEKSALQVPKLTPEERDRAEKFVARGERDLEDGNVALARQSFLRAAEAGLARGALLLAATYDPRELASLRVVGVQPNPAVARKWYERARALGAPEAEDRLVRLSGH